EWNYLASRGRDPVRHPATLGRNQGNAAGADDGGCDLDRGEFGPARIEPRDDLKYGWSLARHPAPGAETEAEASIG
ncbi:MAG TPA: hypothetical protein VFV47_15565, partial [Hyphomicrobiaceae bacterium]|nr:hypothetical protein [Hyphomicrobiaceae bacterium]